MTGGSPLSATAGGGGERLAAVGRLSWARWATKRRWAVARVEAAGRAGERGCWASWLLQTAAGRGVGLRGLMGWIGKRVGVLGIGFRYFWLWV
jgi:hypothetical protein